MQLLSNVWILETNWDGTIKDPYNQRDVVVINKLFNYIVKNEIIMNENTIEMIVDLFNDLSSDDRDSEEDKLRQIIYKYLVETERFDHP